MSSFPTYVNLQWRAGGLHSAIGQLCALLITALCTRIVEPGVELSAVRELEKCVASHLINRGRG